MKTKCKVLVYDAHCAPIKARVDVDVFEEGGYENLGNGTTGPMPGEATYGIELLLQHKPASIAVTITDDGNRYAQNTYLNLNGAVPSRLDLTLYELPDEPGNFGSGGGGPLRVVEGGSLKGVGALHRGIQEQSHWSRHQKKGVENLVSSYLGFVLPNLKADKHSDPFLRIANSWARALERAGIPADLLVQKADVVKAEPALAR